MKILFLTHTFPYPPNDGMRSTCYQLVKHVSKLHEVSLLSLIESEEERKFIPEMAGWCKRIETVVHEVPRSPFRRLKNALFEDTPFCVVQCMNGEFEMKLESLLDSEKFDAVHFTSVNISGYLHCLGKTPGLFFPHDAVSMQFSRNAEREPNLLNKIYIYNQSRKMKRYEKEVIPKFARTVVVSEIDRKWLNGFIPDVSIPVIPGGVDAEVFKKSSIPDEFPSVIFRGVMNFIPNSDAALYFHAEILPLILKEYPSLKYYIVGKNPPPAIQKLNDGKNTFVTGLVSDIREYMARATVNICPMRSGSGMKNKILEAWAMEKPVVATKMATDGIALENGKHLLVAETPRQFADAVIELLKNPNLRDELGRNGRALAVEKYSWTYVASLFDQVYKEMIRRH